MLHAQEGFPHKNSKTGNQLMTPQECAEFLQIEVNTLYVMRSQRRIPYRKVGHLLRFDFDEIVEWTRGKQK
jgi:excisionase family DNA binding protein